MPTFFYSGTVTGQASSVSSGTDDDTDTDQRPVLGTGVTDDYVKTNSAASNMSGYSLVAERLMVRPQGYIVTVTSGQIVYINEHDKH